MKTAYIDTGQVRFAVREMPLEAIHPFAFKAAEAAECAARQGQFWKMHDLIFADQRKLDVESLQAHAKAIGLDGTTFAACLSGSASAKVREDMKSAAALGVMGTPTFFVGIVQADGKLKVLQPFSGALPIDQFKAVIEKALKQAGTRS